MGDVIRGHFKNAALYGKCNACMIGDSLNHPLVQYRFFTRFPRLFPVNYRGGMAVPINTSTGMGVRATSQFATGSGITALAGLLRPGDAFPNSRGNKHNVTTAYPATFSGDVPNGGSQIGFDVVQSDVYQSNPDLGADVVLGMSFRGTTKHPAGWTLMPYNRANAQVPASAAVASAARTTITDAHVVVRTLPFNRTTNPTFNIVGRLISGAETEGPTAIEDIFPLALDYEIVSQATGCKWSFMTEGGMTAKAFATGEMLNGGTWDAGCTDSALDAHIELCGPTHYFIWLGQNNNGRTSAQVVSDIGDLVARLRARHEAGGKPAPYFCLISTYDTADANQYFIEVENGLEYMAANDLRMEFVAVRSRIYNLLGKYSVFAPVYLNPAEAPNYVHPPTATHVLQDMVTSWIQVALWGPPNYPAMTNTATTRAAKPLLGRGILYFAEIDDTTGKPKGGWRDVGNVPEMSLTIEGESIDHSSSREALRQIDAAAQLSKGVKCSFSLDEINDQNLAAFLSGTNDTHDPNSTGSCADIPANEIAAGRWYDLYELTTGHRVLDITPGMLELIPSGVTVLTEGVDYTVDYKHGRVFLADSAAIADVITNGEDITPDVTGFGAEIVHRVHGLTRSVFKVAVKFVSENALNGEKREYVFHRVSLRANGDMSLIGDDWTTLPFEGTIEKNDLADPASPFLTIRTVG